ncbi:histidinol-phosphate aminotransferase [Cellulomonas hominis]|uniref:Histidinol-phosphate aminotransferase n=1 Tax=Cellulomonas hominis TaxID=156981 RepID=A0A511FDD7_9CELL|nr:histidinol-phosphate transaminase [Cellulomonas hominis]MBB5474444.1 histidinol-phosphate aminotransferase [Cellulomonas hominis]GEL46327.1 histidinol-phosphate aminotransferase [Cellulomonas hominis]
MTPQEAATHRPARPALPVRPELAGSAPYGAPQLAVPNLLNVNENPYPPSPQVVADIAAAVAHAAAGLNRYPDREFLDLRGDLADYLAVESGVRVAPEQVWAANGSNEVMLHVLQAFGGPGRTAVSFAPTYSMYPEYARDTHTRWVAGRRTEDFHVDPDEARFLIAREQPSVVLLTSPNNPTGTALDLGTVRAVLDAAAQVPGGCVVVVDEAYAEFRRAGVDSALTLLADHPHLAVSRTMSKAFGLAGARVGYLAASRELVDALRVVRLPYHLSAVTQAVARAALAHRDELMAQVGSLRDERDALVVWLRERGLTVAESDANFVLFGLFEDRHAVWQGLLDRGVLIREVGPEGWLRVSVGTPQETAAFRAALQEVVGL